MLKVYVIGGAGVDSATPSSVVADSRDMETISARNVLVSHVRAQTAAGKRIQRYLDSKKLLPDAFSVGLIADRLAEVQRGWILINFPQTLAQAQLLAGRGHDPDLMIELVLGEEDTLGRFGWGRLCRDCAEGWPVFFDPPTDPAACRSCGKPLGQPPDPQRREEILDRMARHRERTDPLAAHYEAAGKFHSISAAGDFQEVAERLEAVLRS